MRVVLVWDVEPAFVNASAAEFGMGFGDPLFCELARCSEVECWVSEWSFGWMLPRLLFAEVIVAA